MLKKKERLTKGEFDRFFRSGKRTHSATLQLIHTPDTPFHGAAVVGKKVYKRAVDRNRLRRQLYGALYRLNKKENLKGVYMLIAKPSIKEVDQKNIAGEVIGLVGRVAKT